MTPWHVLIIVCALVVPIVCGHSSVCQAALPQIMDLSKIALVGTLGHAGQTLRNNGGTENKT